VRGPSHAPSLGAALRLVARFPALASLALASSCGRGGLDVSASPSRDDAGIAKRFRRDAGTPEHPSWDAATHTGPGAAPPTDAAVVSTDAAPPSDSAQDATADAALRSDAQDASTDAARDAAIDAVTSPDCTCPSGDYFVDVDVLGARAHLGEPYRLSLYCDETRPQLAHPSCGEVYRLSACHGPNNEPPCLYLTVDLAHGPVIGDWVDATGQTSDLLSGVLAPSASSGRVGIGTFSATFQRSGQQPITVSGSFRACMPVMPRCAR
jgi:hypothetical protein